MEETTILETDTNVIETTAEVTEKITEETNKTANTADGSVYTGLFGFFAISEDLQTRMMTYKLYEKGVSREFIEQDASDWFRLLIKATEPGVNLGLSVYKLA